MNDKDREERKQQRRYYFGLLGTAVALLYGIWQGTRGY
jgi:hypothetical protein